MHPTARTARGDLRLGRPSLLLRPLRRQRHEAVELVVEEVKKHSKSISGDMIAQVGTISANGDPTIAVLVSRAP